MLKEKLENNQTTKKRKKFKNNRILYLQEKNNTYVIKKRVSDVISIQDFEVHFVEKCVGQGLKK